MKSDMTGIADLALARGNNSPLRPHTTAIRGHMSEKVSFTGVRPCAKAICYGLGLYKRLADAVAGISRRLSRSLLEAARERCASTAASDGCRSPRAKAITDSSRMRLLPVAFTTSKHSACIARWNVGYFMFSIRHASVTVISRQFGGSDASSALACILPSRMSSIVFSVSGDAASSFISLSSVVMVLLLLSLIPFRLCRFVNDACTNVTSGASFVIYLSGQREKDVRVRTRSRWPTKVVPTFVPTSTALHGLSRLEFGRK